MCGFLGLSLNETKVSDSKTCTYGKFFMKTLSVRILFSSDTNNSLLDG